MSGQQSLRQSIQHVVLSKGGTMNMFSRFVFSKAVASLCDTLAVIEHNHQLPCSNIISNDKNVFLKAQRTYYPLIFNL